MDVVGVREEAGEDGVRWRQLTRCGISKCIYENLFCGFVSNIQYYSRVALV